MPMRIMPGAYEQPENDLDALLRLQAILLSAVEGERGPEVDTEYQALRRALISDPSFQPLTPSFVRRYRDLGSMWPALKSMSPQWQPRRDEVRKQFEPVLAEAERLELVARSGAIETEASFARRPDYDATAWTGATSPSERVRAVRTLLPVAQEAVAQLMRVLETPNHNGGPPLDETEAALAHLRQLHQALGALLKAADEGRLAAAFNEGLATEVARYAKRAARALKDDPLPYAFSGTILAVLSACGLPGIGGFLSGVAANIRKG